jgi:hypothetical protein
MTSEIMHPRLEDISGLLDKATKMINTACKSCITCGHFVEKTEICSLYNARPPAKVIAFACPSYDFIPF